MSPVSPYDEAMEALSSLITKRSRTDETSKADSFDLLFDYIEILELEEPIKQMKIIHVAGTKGKGSTCCFTESILRNCGFHTGLFTSPHLIDVRERFRLDGVDICEEKFMAYFWWCWDRLKERTSIKVPMPTYFHFLALLAFKIFSAEQVDVAILEVGLGGKFDATNVVENPVVCGISSLGYDHMEILGNTLGQIAEQKAGIFKPGVLAFTVPQPEEAMHVLEQKALQLEISFEIPTSEIRGLECLTLEKSLSLQVPLQVVAPLDPNLLNGLHLGLDGEHQYLNAGLAIALCSTWLHRTGHVGVNYLNQTTSLPKEFIEGLTTAIMQGRAQIFTDELIESERSGNLVFYLDGAHSPESMDVCAKWFCRAIKEDNKKNRFLKHGELSDSGASRELLHIDRHEKFWKNSTQILLFNCMSIRDPQLLLPRLMRACATHGVHFKEALFVPNVSLHYKVGASASPQADYQVDLSWQLTLQRIWENVIHGEKGRNAKNADLTYEEGADILERDAGTCCMNSKVFPSLPLAINWLRDGVRKNRSIRFQVLVTGSLHLVGDVLRLIKK